MSDTQTTLRVSGLRVGDTLRGDVTGPGGVLLLARGRRIEPGLLARLEQWGIQEVTLDTTEPPAPPETPETPEADEAATPAEPPQADPPDAPGAPGVEPTRPASEVLLPEAYEMGAEPAPPLPRVPEERFAEVSAAAGSEMSDSIDRYGPLGAALRSGQLGDGGPAVELLLGLRRVGDLDIDLITLMLLLQRPGTPPGLQHAVRHAAVAMRLARGLGLGPDATLDAGLVALFSDIGMSAVAEDLLHRPGKLSTTDWERIHRHCAASADLVAKVRGIRPIVHHAVYQHHERPDGSGYPKGRSGAFLHPLARIASVADVFTAVTEDRPHRPARSPHHAVRATLEGVRAGRLDSAVVRALINEVSLFPLGTPLRLSDGRRGTVHRTDAAANDRPVVRFADGRKPRTVQLSLTPELKITGVEDPPAKRAA